MEVAILYLGGSSMKFNRKRVISLLLTVLFTISMFTVTAYATEAFTQPDTVHENTSVAPQSYPTYLVNESNEFSTIKTIRFTAPKTTTYTVTVRTTAQATVSLSGGTGNNDTFFQSLNNSTYQKRCSFVAGRTYTLQFIPISSGKQLYVAIVHQTFPD